MSRSSFESRSIHGEEAAPEYRYPEASFETPAVGAGVARRVDDDPRDSRERDRGLLALGLSVGVRWASQRPRQERFEVVVGGRLQSRLNILRVVHWGEKSEQWALNELGGFRSLGRCA